MEGKDPFPSRGKHPSAGEGSLNIKLRDFWRNTMSELTVERGERGLMYELFWTVLQGIQQLLSCVGATVLAPILMGIPPNMALFTSGLGTIPYVLVTRLPMFLGSSFAYIAAIALVMEQGSRAEVAGGIIVAGVLNIAVGLVVKKRGYTWINELIPPVVNLNVLIAIGMVLTSVAWGNMSTNWGLGLITIAVVVFFGLAFRQEFFVTGLPLFLGMAVLYLGALLTGLVDTTAVTEAPGFVMPSLVVPTFTLFGVLTIVWPTVATIAEDYADVQAVGVIFEENLDDRVWLSLVMDGVADILSWSGNPSTPYNESVGATQIAKNQRSDADRGKFVPVILVAAILAISAGFLGWVTPLISSIPAAIIGGIFWVILGIIALLGLRLAVSHKVNFMNPHNFLVTGIMSMTWLAGAGGAKFLIAPGLDVGAIAACAILGIAANQLRRWGLLPNLILGLVTAVWIHLGGLDLLHTAVYLGVGLVIPAVYNLMVSREVDFSNRWVQIPGAVVVTTIVALIILI